MRSTSATAATTVKAALALVLAPVLALGGCTESSDVPASFLVGLRVLAIVAAPPQLAAGESATVTAHAVDTSGATPSVSWSRCLVAPLPGQVVSPDCVTVPPVAGAREPLGEGATITAVMPDAAATAGAFGAPDSTGGVYLPLLARVTGPTDALTATYRLRVAQAGQAPNTNPTIEAVVVAGADGGTVALEEATPLVVQAGARLMLGVLVAAGSAEMYTVDRGSGPQTVTETLTTSWFSTAGELDHQKTSAAQPLTELNLERRLPAAPARIDVYAVTRDERGGTDLAHRVLELR